MERCVLAVAGGGALDGTFIARGGEFAVEAFFDHVADGFAQGGDLDAADDFVAEGVAEHGDGTAAGDATGLKIEEGIGVELASGAAVGAFDVVVVDFEEGACIGVGFGGEEDVAVGLAGIGLDGTFLHEDVAVEAGAGRVVEDALVEFVAGAVGSGVLDKDVVVALLVAVEEVETAGIEGCTFALQADDDVVAHVLSAEGDGGDGCVGIAVEEEGGVGELLCWGGHTLQTVETEVGALGEVDLEVVEVGGEEGVACVRGELEGRDVGFGAEDEGELLAGCEVEFLRCVRNDPRVRPDVG